MWLDWLVFCDYGFSVSALWCLLATPTVLLGFLLPWAQPLLLTLDEGYLLTTSPPDLGYRVAPPSHRPWPPAWGSSSRPPPLRVAMCQVAMAQERQRRATQIRCQGRRPRGATPRPGYGRYQSKTNFLSQALRDLGQEEELLFQVLQRQSF